MRYVFKGFTSTLGFMSKTAIFPVLLLCGLLFVVANWWEPVMFMLGVLLLSLLGVIFVAVWTVESYKYWHADKNS